MAVGSTQATRSYVKLRRVNFTGWKPRLENDRLGSRAASGVAAIGKGKVRRLHLLGQIRQQMHLLQVQTKPSFGPEKRMVLEA